MKTIQQPNSKRQLSQETEKLLLSAMTISNEEMPEEMSTQDIQHFETSFEERKRYIIDTLKLEDNKLIDTKQKLEQITQIFLDRWGILDIYGDRLAKFKCQEKLEIVTHGPQVASKTRFVNPILAEKVKLKLQEWIDSGIVIPTTSPWQSPLVIVPKKLYLLLKLRWTSVRSTP